MKNTNKMTNRVKSSQKKLKNLEDQVDIKIRKAKEVVRKSETQLAHEFIINSHISTALNKSLKDMRARLLPLVVEGKHYKFKEGEVGLKQNNDTVVDAKELHEMIKADPELDDDLFYELVSVLKRDTEKALGKIRWGKIHIKRMGEPSVSADKSKDPEVKAKREAIIESLFKTFTK